MPDLAEVAKLTLHNSALNPGAARTAGNGKMIPAILLAAGKSERMGRLKQLIEFRGKTFVQHSVDNLLGSGASEVIVVTGYQAQAVQEALSTSPIRFVHNPRYEKGMSTSIKAGIEALPPGYEAFLLALADQPLVQSATIRRLLREYGKARPSVLIPAFNGRKGHPIIVGADLIAEIRAMEDAIGLNQVLQEHTSSTLLIPVDSESIVIDFDYPGDLEQIPNEFY